MNQLLEELKRRKVARVAVVYAATAFVVLQAADLVLPRLGVPDWAMSLIVLLLLLGFPVALVLGWALELTPDGVRVTASSPDQAGEPTPSLLGRRTVIAAGALILLGSGLGAGLILAPQADEAGPIPDARMPATSLAVLPFLDMSEHGDQEYFSDGLAEELLNALVSIPGLRVAARTSSFSFKGQNVPVEEVAQRLKVTHVLEGGVRRSGDRLRISVQLVSARDGFHVWSQTFERDVEDIFAIQEEISRTVAAELRIRLGDGLRLARTTDPATYDLYLRGRHLWRTGSLAELQQARQYLHQAVERDSSFVLAWVGLADAYSRLANWGHVEPRTVLPRARAAAHRAVVLDSLLAPARGTFGHTLRHWDHDRIGARRELLRALELQPDFADAHEWYAWFLADEGRTAEAVDHYRRAAELDPLSPSAVMMVVNMLTFDGRWDEAIAHAEKAAQVVPNPQAVGTTSYAYALHRTGRGAEAIALLEAVPQPRTLITGMLGHLYAANGQTEAARRILADLHTRASREYVAAMNIAVVHTGLGDHEAALDELERAWQQGSLAPQLNVMPEFEPLRTNPRFRELVRRLGLVDGRGELP